MVESQFAFKSFFIRGLFGKHNVYIDFTNSVQIFVGENGIGKTTIMNALYFTLSRKFRKLREIEFETIELTCKSGKVLTLHRDWLDEDIPNSDSFAERLRHSVPGSVYRRFMNAFYDGEYNEAVSYLRHYGVPQSIIRDVEQLLVHSRRSKQDLPIGVERLEELKNEIGLLVEEEILYFPTYRRIEEDLKNLGYNNNDTPMSREENEVIKFGMNDVQTAFESIEKQIRNFALAGYTQVTGEMISYLVHGKSVVDDKTKDTITNADTLNIVLDRVGENLRKTDREKIRELINTGELFNSSITTFDPLMVFLSKLVEIYESHREKDDAIKSFYNVCNGYLVNKQVIYDESTVKIHIVDTRTNEPIELRNLSSGEKQIVSLFSRIYLSSQSNFIVLFDEPELSLSIEWQEKLLPDILESKRCNFLLAVTHSPFIYANSLREFAKSMDFMEQEVEL